MTKQLQESNNCSMAFIFLSIALGTCEGQSKYTTSSSERNAILPELTIPQGNVQGINFVTRHGRNVSGFLGIPYAQPPIGNRRFKSPVAADGWKGTLYATSDQNMCLQLSGNNEVIGDEDCLYLNVYTPKIPKDESPTLFSVMVFFHGGGCDKGSGSSAYYSPEYLLDEDIVLVVPNYRLAVLGFLSTGDEVAPGNYGLKDMALALKWVQKHIAYFGGDADRVTIFGHSTGAGSTDLLTLSNSTNGLFHRYIIESGSAFSIRSFRPRQTYASRATELGKYLDCPTHSSTQLIDCLMKLNASDIVKTKSKFYVWKTFPDIVWGPTDEPDSDEAFITETPTALYATGRVRTLPSITGVVRDEGLIHSLKFYVNLEMFEEFLTKFDDVLPYVLQYHGYVKDEEAFTKALKAYYFNDLNADRRVLLSNLTKLMSDSMFIYPIYNGLQQRLAYAESITYFYSFEYRGTNSYSIKFSGGSTEDYGVAHSDELLYLFPHPDSTVEKLGKEKSETDYEMVDTMVQLWTSFAIDGKPSSTNLKGAENWRQHSRENNYLMIGNNEKVVSEMHYFFLSDRMRFWKQFNSTTSTEDSTLSSKLSSIINIILLPIEYIVSSILRFVVSLVS